MKKLLSSGKRFFDSVHLPDRFSSLFAFLIMLVHPLIYDDYFFNINRFKFAFLSYAAFGSLIAYLFLCLARRRALSGQTYLPFKLTLADWGMAGFVLTALVSCVLSDDPFSAFTGDEGRLSGLVFILAMGAVYIIVSRAPAAGKWAVRGLLISGAAASALGILNFFYVDPLNFYERLSAKSTEGFISTIGNTNFFGAFLCLYMGAAAAMMFSSNMLVRAQMAVHLALGAGAVIASRSDGALLAPLLSMLFAFVCGVKGRRQLGCACLTASSVFTGFFIVASFMYMNPASFIRMEPNAINTLGEKPVFAALLALLFAAPAFALIRAGEKMYRKRTVALIRKLIAFFLILAAALSFALMIYFTFIRPDFELTGAMRLFRFHDKWGSNRGGVWVRSLKLWGESDLRVKLVGFGPDLLKKPLADAYGQEIIEYCNLSFDNAHNEMIQYLLTLGACGLLSYLALLAGSAKRMLKRISQDPYALSQLFACGVFFVHSLVNVNQPITTPLMFMLLSASVSASEKRCDKMKAVCKEYDETGAKQIAPERAAEDEKIEKDSRESGAGETDNKQPYERDRDDGADSGGA
ncbi:MAG: O-antigen ligase family protein [Clostridia bacterium]|nr:O-antigen ligase family protein [Clostridia bacterium]